MEYTGKILTNIERSHKIRGKRAKVREEGYDQGGKMCKQWYFLIITMGIVNKTCNV